jgi:hypothetical protein
LLFGQIEIHDLGILSTFIQKQVLIFLTLIIS